MEVSFIIPLFNCLPLTQAMLASLRATLPAGLPYEIVFVDDGSTDGTREWLASLSPPAERLPQSSNSRAPAQGSSVRVLLNEHNLGYAAANNRAVAIARGRLLALLNNDLVLQPGWWEPMLATHTRLRDRAGLVGNVQLDAKTGTVDHAGLVVNHTGKPVHSRARPSKISRELFPIRRVPAVTGACVLLEGTLWRQLGGFDEGYVNGGEDIDLCFRAASTGRINAVALRSVVLHHVSSSPGRKLHDEENSFRLARRWRTELIAAADDGTRHWCQEYLVQALADPQAAEFRLALAASAFVGQLRRSPPPEAVAAVSAGLDGEFARWAKMFPA